MLSFLIAVSKSIAKILKTGDMVIYESTVYPGTTEEVCIPILEKYSKLKLNKNSQVLLLGCEGDVDKELYKKLLNHSNRDEKID